MVDLAMRQARAYPDEPLWKAFQEGVRDKRLLWALAYDAPPTFVCMKDIIQKHAKTCGHESLFDHDGPSRKKKGDQNTT